MLTTESEQTAFCKEFNISADKSLSFKDYEQEITDLMGIRILLLFKEDWLQVHDHLMRVWEHIVRTAICICTRRRRYSFI